MEFLLEWGYLGVFVGAFLASTIVPFSSDFVVVGMLLAGGNPLMTIIFATAGNWIGSLTTYGLGRLGKWEWIEKWFKVKRETIEKQKSKIDKYGSLIAFFSWFPVVGDVLSIGLGFYKVNFTKCALFMLIGKAIRFAFWLLMFHLFEGKIPWL